MQSTNLTNQRSKRAITYPVAYSIEGQSIIHIGDAPRERGHRYSCVHCRQAMSAVVLVTRRAPHFRHTNSDHCDPDDALHTYAIQMIQQAHAAAVDAGRTYMLTRPCADCESLATEIDLTDGWEYDTEKSIVPPTRSDVVFTDLEGRQLAVEVVVTHMMERETEAAYSNAGIPVAIVRPTWETVGQLLDKLLVDESRNFDTDACPSCEGVRKKRLAEYEAARLRCEHVYRTRRRTVDRVLTRMERRQSSGSLFCPWYYGKLGEFSNHPTPMYMPTQRKVFANAIILTELGFEQHNLHKPWLFRYPIHKGQRVILYADLGGSDVVPVYKDTAAMLYVFGQSLYDDDETGHAECCVGSPIVNYIVIEAAKRLQRLGVDVRTGFESPVQVERLGRDPLEAIDHDLLRGLLKEIAPRRRRHPNATGLGRP